MGEYSCWLLLNLSSSFFQGEIGQFQVDKCWAPAAGKKVLPSLDPLSTVHCIGEGKKEAPAADFPDSVSALTARTPMLEELRGKSMLLNPMCNHRPYIDQL